MHVRSILKCSEIHTNMSKVQEFYSHNPIDHICYEKNPTFLKKPRLWKQILSQNRQFKGPTK